MQIMSRSNDKRDMMHDATDVCEKKTVRLEKEPSPKYSDKDDTRSKAGKSTRHENNKLPDFEDFFQGNVTENGKKHGKGFMRRLLMEDRRPLLFSCVLFLFQNAPAWILPLITGDVIDLCTSRPDDLVVRLIIDAIICIVLLAQNIPVTMWRKRVTDRMIRTRSAQIKLSVVRKLQKLSITYHREIEEGKIQSKILNDMENVEGYYRTVADTFTQFLLGAIGSAVIAILKNPIAAAFFVIIIPAYILVSIAFRNHLRKYSRRLRKDKEQLSAKLTTALQMMPLTKSHGLVDLEEQEVGKKIDTVTESGLKLDRTNASFGSASWVCSQAFSLLCLAFCVVLALNDIMTVGDVVLFQSLFSTISSSVMTLIAVYPSFITGNEAVSSLAEIMQNDDIEHDDDKVSLDQMDGRVDFDHVSYHYPNSEKLVVNDLDLHIRQGERIAVVGSSGSGKSTVMNLLIGLLSPTSGEIFVDGIPMSEMSMRSYRRFISVVPQNSILFSGTIRENITYGLDSYSEEALQKAVEDANITEFLKELPNGLETPVGEHGDKLSGGQKQRISIARALIRDPKLLILDEATSALDNVSEYHVQKAIDKLVNARTTFIVAHRLSTIRNADRIVVMEDGKMVEVGTYDELMSLGGRFCELERKSRIREEEAKAALEAEA